LQNVAPEIDNKIDRLLWYNSLQHFIFQVGIFGLDGKADENKE
jgi:hypothetical protein